MRKHTTIRTITFLTAVFFLQIGNTQTVADFENFNLASGNHLNDASPSTVFQSGAIDLPNFFDAEFNFWTGWAISADTNTTTPGFTNQYSAIPGEGAINSASYCIGYVFDPITIRLQPNAIGKPMIGMYITNSTYTYLSMRDGDPFAKKFGGETGEDPDFLMITFKKYTEGSLGTDSVNVYLADYRFNDANMDYLVSDWIYVDLNALGTMDSLSLRMTSSDNGAFGMNTPAYVCVDQVTTDDLQSRIDVTEMSANLKLAPNPVSERLFVEINDEGQYSIANMQGSIVWSSYFQVGKHEILVSSLPSGMYVIRQNGGVGVKICIQ